ncbi:MAG: hypothetical protein IJQ79_02735 [Bacteroidales bacterium]|nr:hypothetical protein [Bacteroidales bacterium]
MKKVVLILSRMFPLYHPKRGKPTGFAENFGSQKVHTIRAGYERWKHNLDKVISGDFTLSVRQWSGHPYNSKQVELARFTGSKVGYQRISMTYDPSSGELKAVIDGRRFTDVERLARNDGLSLQDFTAFFFNDDLSEKQLFQGIIIHFTDMRY